LLHPHDPESLSLATSYMFGPSSRSGRTNTASADFWKPLRIPYEILSPMTGSQTSPGKNNHLPPTSAAFTALPLDGYGLCLVT